MRLGRSTETVTPAVLEKLTSVHAAPSIIRPLPASAGRHDQGAWMPARSVAPRSSWAQVARRAGDEVDFAVGFSRIKKVGERVEPNEPLLFVHARKPETLDS